MSCCRCFLVYCLLGENTLYHSFDTSSNSSKNGLNVDSDILDSLALVPPECTQRLHSMAVLLWQRHTWKRTENIILWATLTWPKKIWIKRYKYSPCHVTMEDDWVFILSSPINSPAFYSVGWTTHYEKSWTEPCLSSLDLGAEGQG